MTVTVYGKKPVRIGTDEVILDLSADVNIIVSLMKLKTATELSRDVLKFSDNWWLDEGCGYIDPKGVIHSGPFGWTMKCKLRPVLLWSVIHFQSMCGSSK